MAAVEISSGCVLRYHLLLCHCCCATCLPTNRECQWVVMDIVDEGEVVLRRARHPIDIHMRHAIRSVTPPPALVSWMDCRIVRFLRLLVALTADSHLLYSSIIIMLLSPPHHNTSCLCIGKDSIYCIIEGGIRSIEAKGSGREGVCGGNV